MYLLNSLWQFTCNIASQFPVVFFAVPAKNMEDVELALSIAEHPEHFDELFNRFFPRVYQYFYFRLRHTQNAEDLTADTFVKIYERLHTYTDTGAPFTAWLFAVARNVLNDYFRSNKPDTYDIDDIADADLLVSEFALDSIDRKLAMEKVWEVIHILPQAQQDVWALKLVADLPHKEIATMLGTTENNVNVMINRSMATLKKRLSYLTEDHA